MPGIYRKNGKNMLDVKKVVDTGDGFIRVEVLNGSIEFIHKSEIDRITLPVEDRSK